jgi:hypothetical protein
MHFAVQVEFVALLASSCCTSFLTF